MNKTVVKSLPGAKVNDITKYLNNDDGHYRQIVICVGTNDCTEDLDMELVGKQYEDLVQMALKKVATKDDIHISSMPPRTDVAERQRRVEELNTVIQELVAKVGVKLTSHDTSFRLADGQPNDGYLLADGLHLNQRGSNRLARNLGLASATTNVTTRKIVKSNLPQNRNIDVAMIATPPTPFSSMLERKPLAMLSAPMVGIHKTMDVNDPHTRAAPSHNREPMLSRASTVLNRVIVRTIAVSETATCRQCSQQGHKQKFRGRYRY